MPQNDGLTRLLPTSVSAGSQAGADYTKIPTRPFVLVHRVQVSPPGKKKAHLGPSSLPSPTSQFQLCRFERQVMSHLK